MKIGDSNNNNNYYFQTAKIVAIGSLNSIPYGLTMHLCIERVAISSAKCFALGFTGASVIPALNVIVFSVAAFRIWQMLMNLVFDISKEILELKKQQRPSLSTRLMQYITG